MLVPGLPGCGAGVGVGGCTLEGAFGLSSCGLCLVLPVVSCVALGETLNLFEPLSPPLSDWVESAELAQLHGMRLGGDRDGAGRAERTADCWLVAA